MRLVRLSCGLMYLSQRHNAAGVPALLAAAGPGPADPVRIRCRSRQPLPRMLVDGFGPAEQSGDAVRAQHDVDPVGPSVAASVNAKSVSPRTQIRFAYRAWPPRAIDTNRCNSYDASNRFERRIPSPKEGRTWPLRRDSLRAPGPVPCTSPQIRCREGIPMTDLPVSRRRFLAAAALTAGAAALPGGFRPTSRGRRPAPGHRSPTAGSTTLPRRPPGPTASSPATASTAPSCTGRRRWRRWSSTTTASSCPTAPATVTPPVHRRPAGSGVRDKALAGDYAGASTGLRRRVELRWTQTYHPGYELRISTPGMTTANDVRPDHRLPHRRGHLHLDRRARHLDPPGLRLPRRPGRRPRTDPGARAGPIDATLQRRTPRSPAVPRHASDSPPWPTSATAPAT